MELLLWRHADALQGEPDIARELSPHGWQQARKVAAWLDRHAPENLRLVVSPAVRTRQTVSCFRDDESSMQFCPPLFEGASPDTLLALLDWPQAAAPVLVVGHQPLLGLLAAHLLTDTATHPGAFRKSALWWLSGEPGNVRLIQLVDGDTLA